MEIDSFRGIFENRQPQERNTAVSIELAREYRKRLPEAYDRAQALLAVAGVDSGCDFTVREGKQLIYSNLVDIPSEEIMGCAVEPDWERPRLYFRIFEQRSFPSVVTKRLFKKIETFAPPVTELLGIAIIAQNEDGELLEIERHESPSALDPGLAIPRIDEITDLTKQLERFENVMGLAEGVLRPDDLPATELQAV